MAADGVKPDLKRVLDRKRHRLTVSHRSPHLL